MLMSGVFVPKKLKARLQERVAMMQSREQEMALGTAQFELRFEGGFQNVVRRVLVKQKKYGKGPKQLKTFKT